MAAKEAAAVAVAEEATAAEATTAAVEEAIVAVEAATAEEEATVELDQRRKTSRGHSPLSAMSVGRKDTYAYSAPHSSRRFAMARKQSQKTAQGGPRRIPGTRTKSAIEHSARAERRSNEPSSNNEFDSNAKSYSE